FVKRHRKFNAQVVALALKQMMWRDRDRDQHVAGLAARHGEPLPFQPDLLAVGEAGRDLDLKLLAGRKLDAPRRTLGRFLKSDRCRRGDIAARRLRDFFLLELEAAATA